MKKMIVALPVLIMLSCSSTQNTTSTTSTDGMSIETTAMSGDMTDTTGTLTTTASTDVRVGNETGTYVSGSATVNNTTGNWNDTSRILGRNAYWYEGSDPWTASPRNNWYNRYNTTGDDWMSVYYTEDDMYDETGMMRDTSLLYGSWTLTMTPDLATAWRNDLNENGYVYTNLNGVNGQAYVSGSATVGTSGVNANASASTGTTTSSTNVNGSTATMSSTTWNNTNGMSPNMYSANGNMYSMPRLNLYLTNGSFAGFTGCNNISGRLMVTGDNTLRFENTTPSTVIDCAAGFDQNVLLERMRRIDNYAVVNNQLQLRQGDQVLLVLDRTNQ